MVTIHVCRKNMLMKPDGIQILKFTSFSFVSFKLFSHLFFYKPVHYFDWVLTGNLTCIPKKTYTTYNCWKNYKNTAVVRQSLTLFAGDIHSQYCDWNVVFVGSHVLQNSRIQLFLEFTQVSRCETFQNRSGKQYKINNNFIQRLHFHQVKTGSKAKHAKAFQYIGKTK